MKLKTFRVNYYGSFKYPVRWIEQVQYQENDFSMWYFINKPDATITEKTVCMWRINWKIPKRDWIFVFGNE